MLWVAFALLTAFFSATEVTVIKSRLGDLPPFAAMAYPLIYSLPLFLLGAPFVETPEIAPGFWAGLCVLVPLNGLGYYLTIRAISISPLSMTMPFQALTPAIVLLTGFLLLGEIPSLEGALGVFSIVAGSWVIGLDGGEKTLLGPIKAIFRERGAVLMIMAAVVWSVCAVLGKKLIMDSSVSYAAVVFFIIHNTAIILFLLLVRKITPRSLLARPASGFAAGALLFLHTTCHFISVALITTAYMIAVKRLSVIFSVIYGGLVFHEKNIALKLAGAALMTLGAVIITVWG